jgi:hypothetical protein
VYTPLISPILALVSVTVNKIHLFVGTKRLMPFGEVTTSCCQQRMKYKHSADEMAGKPVRITGSWRFGRARAPNIQGTSKVTIYFEK